MVSDFPDVVQLLQFHIGTGVCRYKNGFEYNSGTGVHHAMRNVTCRDVTTGPFAMLGLIVEKHIGAKGLEELGRRGGGKETGDRGKETEEIRQETRDRRQGEDCSSFDHESGE